MKIIAIAISALAIAGLALLWIFAPWLTENHDQAQDAEANRDADHSEFPW